MYRCVRLFILKQAVCRQTGKSYLNTTFSLFFYLSSVLSSVRSSVLSFVLSSFPPNQALQPNSEGLKMFKNALRDFLISVKEFSAEDNADLYVLQNLSILRTQENCVCTLHHIASHCIEALGGPVL